MADRRGAVFWQGDTRKRHHLEDLGIDSIMLKWIFKRCDGGGTDWIGLTEDRGSRSSFVNVAMNLGVP